MDGSVSLTLLVVVCCAYAQQYGPVPPSYQHFPGATLIQAPRQTYRQRFNGPRVPESFQTIEHHPATRARRPQIIRKVNPLLSQQQIIDHSKASLIEDVPVPIHFTNAVSTPVSAPFQPVTTRTALTPRPVQEEVVEEDSAKATLTITPSTTAYTTSLRSSFVPTPTPVPPVPSVPSVPLVQPQAPSGFQKPQYLGPSAFRPSPFQNVAAVPVPVSVPVSLADIPLKGRPLVRQQVRPVQQASIPTNQSPSFPIVAPPSPPQLPQIVAVSPQPVKEEDYFRQVQGHPLKKQEPVRQQIIEKDQYRQYPLKQPEVNRLTQTKTQQEYSKPAPRQPHAKTPTREKKPVAQTIRKYHEEHEDGSITWGYENDDGSFKEETIGVDCVTRGKYGYYDPDGVKREYTYQTGIPCVKAEENEEAESALHGYIDYTNNKYVFPNGDEIDLEAMVKNRARKPVSQHRVRS